jgi:hypothetical protein
MANFDCTFEEEVLQRLARIETYVEIAPVKFEDHEKRLRAVEKRQWMIAGAAGVFGALCDHLGFRVF